MQIAFENTPPICPGINIHHLSGISAQPSARLGGWWARRWAESYWVGRLHPTLRYSFTCILASAWLGHVCLLRQMRFGPQAPSGPRHRSRAPQRAQPLPQATISHTHDRYVPRGLAFCRARGKSPNTVVLKRPWDMVRLSLEGSLGRWRRDLYCLGDHLCAFYSSLRGPAVRQGEDTDVVAVRTPACGPEWWKL